jgi:hypothetical protein
MSTPDERNKALDEIAETVAGPGPTAEPDESSDQDTRDDPRAESLGGNEPSDADAGGDASGG